MSTDSMTWDDLEESPPAPATKQIKATPKLKSSNKKKPVTIRFEEADLAIIIEKIGDERIPLRPVLRQIILDHYGIK